MKGVAKFVKKGAYFVKSQQAWGVSKWFGEIANNSNMWTHDFAFKKALFMKVGHPCATIFTFSRKKIAVKNTYELPIAFIKDFKGLYILVINGVVFGGLKGDLVKTASMFKDSLNDIF